ncbi:MAG: phytochelatin synthase family protein [Abditibacteriales bacterium]|nr:phytochelatin synthase family protein [Abditibacteriales bacterium]MDW8366277.1 papain-like cysteine protease family protein [Abditibacteriales bacterium]
MDIPYEKQEDTKTQRTCGAAALAMIYRSFGLGGSQAEIWREVATPAPKRRWFFRQRWFTQTHRLCAHALRCGLCAVTVRAKDPLRVLRLCCERSIRVILNHRQSLKSDEGHFTVLVDVTEENVVCHDPLKGPSLPFSHNDLLSLWMPRGKYCEITGRILIALTAAPSGKTSCAVCGAPIPNTVPCPRCAAEIPLQPTDVLGCVQETCPERLWEKVVCPHCDAAIAAL